VLRSEAVLPVLVPEYEYEYEYEHQPEGIA